MKKSSMYKKIIKILNPIGYHSLTLFLKKFFLPIVAIFFGISLFLALFIQTLSIWTSVIIFFIGIFIAIGYPLGKYGAIKQNIHSRLHFFITYAGTIATMKISRNILFERVSEKEIFGEISKIFGKTFYLAKSWNLGFAKACRTMSTRTPSKILADFLDRLAIIMDFGEELDNFLYSEQKSVLEDYGVEYHKSLEHIKMVQEFFISFSISFAFILAILLLAPILIGIPVTNLLIYALIGILFLNVILLVSIKVAIPGDSLINPESRNYAQKKILITFLVCLSVTLFLFIGLFFFTGLNFLMCLALSSTILLYPGFLAVTEEKEVMKRDVQFPIFTRVLGSAIEVRNGGVVSALEAVQVHYFGSLNETIVNLYKRLKIGSNKFKAWSSFATESGSNLIANFCRIFSESVYLGGKAEKIGEIISKNMNKLLSLRKLRGQLSGGMRGALYGSYLGIVVTVFITAKVSEVLLGIFRPAQDTSPEMAAIMGSIIGIDFSVNFPLVLILLSLIVLIIAVSSALIIKFIDGGSLYAALIDFVILIWIAAIISMLAPSLLGSILPETIMMPT